jgi:hypothetical protein
VLPTPALRCLFSILTLLAFAPIALAEEVRVTVVTILATPDRGKIDPGMEQIAAVVQGKQPNLKGFQMRATSGRSIAVGNDATFKLIENYEVTVTVNHGANKHNKIGLTVTSPALKSPLSYCTCCGKFLPIITPYKTKEGEWVIVAIRVNPCVPAKE